MYGQVYLITNTVNGKRYVGQTARSVARRFYEHSIGMHETPVYFAMQKYGKENFTIETLVTAETLEQLNKDEDFYILLCGSLSPGGYNLKRGGGTGKMTDEARENRRGPKNGFFGKKHSPEALAKMQGRKFSAEHVAKLSAAAQNRSDEWREKQSLVRKGMKMPWMCGKNSHSYRHEISTEQIISEYLAGTRITVLERKIGMSRAGIRRRLRNAGVWREAA